MESSRATDRRDAFEEARVGLARFTEGVAHVVRNPLTGIGAGVEVLGRLASSDALTQENVAAILREVDRVNDLLEEMLRITHPPRLSRAPADVAGLLSQAAGEAGEARPEGAGVDVSCEGIAGRPLLDGEQFRQAIKELIANAMEAAPAGSRVRVRAWRAEEGGAPLLAVAVDNGGGGFPQQVLAHAFEPFRTTKAGRKGIGLYIANDIVRRHGGELRLASPEGGGARATMLLPWEMNDDDRD